MRQTNFIMAKNLVIVESPAKAKTIEKFLGKDFQVESSYGHIADLPSKEIGVDVENGFKPKYEVSSDKKALVKKLKDLSKKAKSWITKKIKKAKMKPIRVTIILLGSMFSSFRD